VLAGVLAGHVAHPVDVLDQVYREAYGALLLGDGPADGLADPPRRVRRELVPAEIVELLHGAHQAGVALLDQVEHRHAGAHVAPGDRHDEAQVGPDELVLGLRALGHQALQLGPGDPFASFARFEKVFGIQPHLDGLREIHLFRRVE